MMKRILTIALACILVAALLIPAISAQPRHGARTGVHQPGMQGWCKGMDLTDEQQSKMTDLRLKLQKELLPLRTELQSKVAEIQLMKTENAPSLNKIDKLIDDAQEVRAKMAKAKVRHQLEVRKLLTLEQQKMFDSRMLQMPERKWKGRGMQ
jgi:Spy/CpxP family protein refolding chaperone